MPIIGCLVALIVCIAAVGSARAQLLPEPVASTSIDEVVFPDKRVLLLHSYTARVRYTRVQDTVIREGVARGYRGSVSFFTAELDFNLEEEMEGWSSVRDFLKKRYESRSLDLIIATDTPALRFLQSYGPDAFPGVPVVFSASKEAPADALRERCEITGVVETMGVRETIELMRRFHPGTRRLIAITNSSIHGKELEEKTVEALASIGDPMEVEWLRDLGVDEMIARLSDATDDSAVLFLTYWDVSGKRSTLEGTLGAFTRVCPRPTYVLYDTYLGYGALGGCVASAEAYGEAATTMAVRVLNGERAADIPVVASFNPTLLDARAVRRFGIPTAAIPVNAEIRFIEPTFFERNSRIIAVASAIALVEGIIIGWLVLSRRRLRKAKNALRRSEERFRALGDNLPGMLYTTVRSRSGHRVAEYLGPGLESMVGAEAAAIIRADFDRFFDYVHPDDVAAISAERIASMAQHRAFDAQYRLRAADGSYRWMRATARATALEAGAVRWHGVLLDIHAAKENEHALARRESILHAIADAGRLLSQAPDPLTTMNSVVRLLGSAAGADRAYLFDRVNDPALGWVNRMIAEWTSDLVRAQIDDPQFAYLPDSAWDRERWLEPLARGEAIVRATADCPEPERSYFESQGLKSVAIVPVMLPGRWWGFLGFDACEHAMMWKEVETDALSTAANAIAAALERREREAKLREKDESLRRVAENIPGFIYRTAMDRDEMIRLEYVSPGFEDIYGSPPKWSPRPLTDPGEQYSAEDRERAVSGMRRSARTLEPYDLVARVNRLDGGNRWVHIRATASRRGADTVFDGVVIDVTQRMSAEEALRSSEERYRYVFQATNDVIWDWDVASDRISWSDSLRNSFGISGDSLDTPASACFERIHPDDRGRVRAGLARVVDGADESWRDEYRFKRTDGPYAWVVDRAHVVRDASNRALRVIGALTDITPLRETEQRLRVALQAGQMATWEWDIDSGIVSHSIEFGPMFGLPASPGPTREQDIQTRIVAEDRELKPSAARLALEGDDPAFSTVCRVPLDDGTTRWVACEGRSVRNDPTGSRRIVGVSFDITRLKHAELAVRESEERYRAVFQALPIGVCVHDGERFLFANDALRALLRAPTIEAVLAVPLAEAMHPADLPGCAARAHSVLVGNREAGPREVRFIAHDGTIVEVEVRCNPMQYGGRRLVQTTIVDLTERKQAESALRESEEKFRQITENAAEIFWLNEINPRTLRYISPAFESIWGITVEEVMSTPGRFFDTIHPDDRARVEKTAAGNTTGFNHEYRIVRPDGTIRWVHDRAYPVRDASGRTVRIAGVAEDITDAKAAEEALRHTSQTQQLLLSELDHRVKNSLTSLVTLIDLTSAETEGVREFADSIRARVLAMSSVHSLLSEGHWSPVPLERVVRALSPPETIGTIEVEGPPVDVPARQVTAFAMIVQELFTNSLKYGAAGHAAGLVSVKWNIEEGSATHNPSPRLHLRWHESNVPAIALPATPGVGTRLIQGFCKFELNGRANFEYHANEVRHNFMFTLDNDPPPLPDPKLIRSDAAPASDFSHVTLRNPA